MTQQLHQSLEHLEKRTLFAILGEDLGCLLADEACICPADNLDLTSHHAEDIPEHPILSSNWTSQLHVIEGWLQQTITAQIAYDILPKLLITSAWLAVLSQPSPLQLLDMHTLLIDVDNSLVPLNIHQILALELIHIYHMSKIILGAGIVTDLMEIGTRLAGIDFIKHIAVDITDHFSFMYSAPMSFIYGGSLVLDLVCSCAKGFGDVEPAQTITDRLNAWNNPNRLLKINQYIHLTGIAVYIQFQSSIQTLLAPADQLAQDDLGRFGFYFWTHLIASAPMLYSSLQYAQSFQAFKKLQLQPQGNFLKSATYLGIAVALWAESIHDWLPQKWQSYLHPQHRVAACLGSVGFVGGMFHPDVSGVTDFTWSSTLSTISNKKSLAAALFAGGVGTAVGHVLDEWIDALTADHPSTL